jgi:hypothetical protein
MKNSLRSVRRLNHSFLVAYHHGGTDTSQPKGMSPFCFAELTAKQKNQPLRALSVLSASAVHHSYPLNSYITSLWVPHVG